MWKLTLVYGILQVSGFMHRGILQVSGFMHRGQGMEMMWPVLGSSHFFVRTDSCSYIMLWKPNQFSNINIYFWVGENRLGYIYIFKFQTQPVLS